MMNASMLARSATTSRFPYAPLSAYSPFARLSEHRVQNRLPDYLQGWSEADPAKIRAAVTASYRFHDPLIGTFSQRSLHEYFDLLQDRLLCSGPIDRLDIAFFLRGPMDQLPPSTALRFSREAPRVGLTGICEIERAEGGVVSERVEYDLNLASNLLRSASSDGWRLSRRDGALLPQPRRRR
jgi:hypothetical protein